MKSIFTLTLLFFFALAQGQVLWTISNETFEQGDTVEAKFYVHGFKNIGSFSYTMRHDTAFLERAALTFTGAMPNFGTGNFSFHGNGYANLPGEIRTLRSQATGTTVEDGAHIYTVKFIAKQSGNLSDKFWLWANHPVLKPDAIVCTDAPPYMENVGLDIAYTETGETSATVQPTASELFTIYPNPATDTSTLCLELEQPQSVLLNIFDANGYVVFGELVRHNGGKQYYTLTFPPQAGVYYVRVQHGDTCTTKTITKH